jgi:hypothetical protein
MSKNALPVSDRRISDGLILSRANNVSVSRFESCLNSSNILESKLQSRFNSRLKLT